MTTQGFHTRNAQRLIIDYKYDIMYISLRVRTILIMLIHPSSHLFVPWICQGIIRMEDAKIRFDRMKHVLPVYSFPIIGGIGDLGVTCMYFF